MRAGFGSPSFLKMVIGKQRNLTHKSMAKVAIGFNFSKEVTELFCLLVVENQTKFEEEREANLKALLAAKERFQAVLSKIKYDDIGNLSFFLKWNYIALYEYIGTELFDPDLKSIQAKFSHRLSIAEIEDSLGLLLESKLIKADPHKGYVKTKGVVDLTGRFSPQEISTFYAEMMNQSLYAMTNSDLEDCYFSSSTMHIDPKYAKEIKVKVLELKKEVVALVEGDYAGNEVFQFNAQFFSLLDIVGPK